MMRVAVTKVEGFGRDHWRIDMKQKSLLGADFEWTTLVGECEYEEVAEIWAHALREHLEPDGPEGLRVWKAALDDADAAADTTGVCAYCEGTFPESALNFSGGDPACTNCFTRVNPKPIPNPRDYP